MTRVMKTPPNEVENQLPIGARSSSLFHDDSYRNLVRERRVSSGASVPAPACRSGIIRPYTSGSPPGSVTRVAGHERGAE